MMNRFSIALNSDNKNRLDFFYLSDAIEYLINDVETDANVYRFANYTKALSKDTQLILISHRKGTMESADALYGVTMEEKGVSRVLSVKV